MVYVGLILKQNEGEKKKKNQKIKRMKLPNGRRKDNSFLYRSFELNHVWDEEKSTWEICKLTFDQHAPKLLHQERLPG